jgi:hypothetical protein
VQQRAADHDAIGAVFIRDGTQKGLCNAPDQLAYRQRKADRDDAEPGRRNDRQNEKPERLPDAHGDQENARRRQHQRDPWQAGA